MTKTCQRSSGVIIRWYLDGLITPMHLEILPTISYVHGSINVGTNQKDAEDGAAVI